MTIISELMQNLVYSKTTIRCNQHFQNRFPEMMEEIAVNLTDFVAETETLTLEHVNGIVRKRVQGGKDLDIGDRTRPNVKVSF